MKWVVLSDLSVEQNTCIFMPGHKQLSYITIKVTFLFE